MPHTTETPKQYQCRHIFTDGHRCSSPCLRQQEFCYYHHTTRKPIANPGRRRSRSSTFHLPLPEDRSAIQSSIGEVLQRIAANEIDPRRAGLLLYGLQIASLNLPKTPPATHHYRNSATQRNQNSEPVETVEEIIIDPELGVLAPRTEVGQATQRKSAVHLLIEKMMRSDEEAKAAAAEVAAQEPTVLPNLQATESRPPQTQHTWPPRQRRQQTMRPMIPLENRHTSSCSQSREPESRVPLSCWRKRVVASTPPFRGAHQARSKPRAFLPSDTTTYRYSRGLNTWFR
jgi:hypothetical protein